MGIVYAIIKNTKEKLSITNINFGRCISKNVPTDHVNCQTSSIAACTPLHVAAQQGYASCIQKLVDAGADMYARDIWASIPLHRAAMNNKPAAIMQLIECGCDPQVKNKFGKTALHFAALGGGLESAKVLVMNNLNYHEKDGQGFSSLDIARVYSHHEVEWWFLKNPSPEVMRLPMAVPKAKDSECSSSGLPVDGSLPGSSSPVSPLTNIVDTVTYSTSVPMIYKYMYVLFYVKKSHVLCTPYYLMHFIFFFRTRAYELKKNYRRASSNTSGEEPVTCSSTSTTVTMDTTKIRMD